MGSAIGSATAQRSPFARRSLQWEFAIILLLPLQLTLVMLPFLGLALNGVTTVIYGFCAELCCARAAHTFAQGVLHNIDRGGRGFAAGRWISQRPHRHPRQHHRRVHVNARHDSVRISSQGPTPHGFHLGRI
jgi:hypothetical protein